MPMLSKSRLLSSLQCAKRVWLEVHRPELRADSSATAASFAAGNEVGAVARRLYDPDGVGTVLDVGEIGVGGLLARTRELLGQRRPLFEAGFATGGSADGALALADVLLPDAQGAWRMVEVKSSTEVKDYHRQDAAIQFYIATQARVPVSRVAVAHIDNGWTYPGNGAYAGLLREEDLTDQVRALQPQVPGWIAAAHAAVAASAEPATTMGAQCSKPYDCGFRAHCERQAEAAHGPVEFPVQWLPRPGKLLKEHVAAHGVRSMADVPDALLSQQQLRVKQVTLQGAAFFDRAGAANALKQHGLPAYFLDFETISFAVPVWPGTRPFQQIPFQYSLHVLDSDGELAHCGFLDLEGGDPSPALARSLVDACGDSGPVYAYNAGFEAGVLRDLAQRFPDLGPALLSIEQRLVDLLPVARDHFYHPSQQGSWSIKRVLPALVPELRYSDLDGVQDGGKAQQAYVEAIAAATGAERREQLRAQLWAYCRLDTLAMVELWRRFGACQAM